MATGDIPPHFYLNPSEHFAYHYGLQVYAAILMRTAGLQAWSSFDLSRAFSLALTFWLSVAWFSRYMRSQLAVISSALLTVFAGGTRWLLLLIPTSLLERISAQIVMINTGANTASTLIEALGSTWVLEGAAGIAFPFAFHNGIFMPAHFILGSTGAMPFFTVMLILVMVPKIRLKVPAGIILTLITASLALSAENIFVFFWLGIAASLLLFVISDRGGEPLNHRGSRKLWVWVLLSSAFLAVIQGGFITEFIRTALLGITGTAGSVTANYHGFSLRFPPALPNAHVEALQVSNISHLIVLLFELGPVLILVPLVFSQTQRWILGGKIERAGLSAAALLGFVFPLFVQYGVDRSSTRLAGTSMWLWLVLGLPLFSMWLKKRRELTRTVSVLGLGLAAISGIIIFSLEMTVIHKPQFTYFVDHIDARVSSRYWDRLPEGSQVLDRIPYRSVTLFGRPAHAFSGIYSPLPFWRSLVSAPYIQDVIEADFQYVYMDSDWWSDIEPAMRESYKADCVKLIDEISYKNVEFRRLYDLRACAD
ncbi:MAG: hypothetical protein P1P76_02250 [Anaerolineales bacterium]|nr:hypothetical protein [Anaerolineales bacterium]